MVQEVAVAVEVVVDGAEVIADVPRLLMQLSMADMFHRRSHSLVETFNNPLQGIPQTLSNDTTTGIIATRVGLTLRTDIHRKHAHRLGVRLGIRLGARATMCSSTSLRDILLE